MNITKIIAGLKQRLISYMYGRYQNDTYILMFHEVTNGDVAINSQLSINKNSFIRLLDKIEYEGISFDKIDAIFQFGKKRVILTFDDVWGNVVNNAVPILTKRKIPFAIFICPDYIDKPQYITSAQIKELIDNPLCTIGYHTQNHPAMRELSENNIKKTINQTDFENKYGVKCEYFAYPYGSVYMCPKRVIRIVSRSDYKAAFGTINSPAGSRIILKEPFYIPRINVSEFELNKVLSLF